MEKNKELLLNLVRRRAVCQARQLAAEILGAASQEKEAILAGTEFELWLADSCEECKEPGPDC